MGETKGMSQSREVMVLGVLAAEAPHALSVTSSDHVLFINSHIHASKISNNHSIPKTNI